MTGMTVYAIWASNGKKQKDKLFLSQKKAHDAAIACKRKGLKFFAGSFYTNYCGAGHAKFGIGTDNLLDANESELVLERLQKKVEWFSKSVLD